MTFNLNNLNMFFALLAKIVTIYISISKKKKKFNFEKLV